MAGLERFRGLVLWGNVAGFLPFRMELDRDSGKFRRFTFSWRDPLVYWLITSFVLQTFLNVYFEFKLYIERNQFLAPLNATLQITYHIMRHYLTVLSYVPYLLLYRWKDLQAATKYALKFDRMMSDVTHKPCKMKRRIFIGVILLTAYVCPSNQ